MSMQRNDGGPAFPGSTSPKAEDVLKLRDGLGLSLYDAKTMLSYSGGMSLRDWFAGQALASIPDFSDMPTYIITPSVADEIARTVYQLADALLAAREVRS